MAVHKLSSKFNTDFNVDWPCPECGQLTLQIDKESFRHENTAETRKGWSEDWFEIEMSRFIFTCIARCSRPSCGEVVVCQGKGRWEEDTAPSVREQQHRPFFRPLSFLPALHPFQLPDRCPEEISAPLTGAFSVFLMQPGAAANLIRIAVERMLTAMNVSEGKVGSLHRRLEALSGPYARYKKRLLAIKFLGNAGSHSYDEVKIDDIEDAFGIMDHTLNELFSGRKEDIDILTKRLNDKFEPRKPKEEE